MIAFHSGLSQAVNTKSAVRECLDHAFGEGGGEDCSLLIVHSTIGHNFAHMAAAIKAFCPRARIVGCSGSGVIGREGVTEAMRAMAIMAITGDEFAVAAADGLSGQTSADLGRQAAQDLKDARDGIGMIYVLSGGLSLAGDRVIEGIESVFGTGVPIFGATAADNGKAKKTFQFHDSDVLEDGVVLVGFADPSLEVLPNAHHGSIAVEGTDFLVTKSEENRVIELDGQPAWPYLLERFGLTPQAAELSATLPITGLGEPLEAADREAYDNPQILRVPIKVSRDLQSFYLPASVAEGTRLQLMQRDEQYIFEGLDRLMERMVAQLNGRRPLAVFHADCMARGRFMFNRVLKDEIIAKMQYPLCGDDIVPWLGVYGFSEYCPVAGRNRFHSYTSALFPIVRREVA